MITSTSQPYFVMSTGTTPSWTGRDPRSQLTNANALTWQQTHPSLAGVESESAFQRILAWLRGEH
jgi:hypothetical protein